MAPEEPMSHWSRIFGADGREYFWNTATQQTQWGEPTGGYGVTHDPHGTQFQAHRLVEDLKPLPEFNLLADHTEQKTAAAEDKTNLSVRGYLAHLYRGDETASALEAGRHLVPWDGDPQVAIDRFDARALISKSALASAVGPRSRPDGNDNNGVSETVLEKERYADYPEWKLNAETSQRFAGDLPPPPPEPPQRQQERAAIPPPQAPTARGEHSKLPETAPKFIPSFPIPARMAIPQTLKLHQVVAKTAKYTKAAGEHAEAVLRIRQKGNSLFKFLEPDHPLHAYYCYLKETGYEHDEEKIRNGTAHKDGEAEHEVVHRVVFKPGKIGFQFKGRLVTKVDEGTQAHNNGIQPGWMLMEINGKPSPVGTLEIIKTIKTLFAGGVDVAVAFHEPNDGKNVSQSGESVKSSEERRPGTPPPPPPPPPVSFAASLFPYWTVPDSGLPDCEAAEHIQSAISAVVKLTIQKGRKEAEKVLKGATFLFPFLESGSKHHVTYVRTLARARAEILEKELELKKKHGRDCTPTAPNVAQETKLPLETTQGSNPSDARFGLPDESKHVIQTPGAPELEKVKAPTVEHITPEEAMEEIERERKREAAARAEKEQERLKRRLEREARIKEERMKREERRKRRRRRRRDNSSSDSGSSRSRSRGASRTRRGDRNRNKRRRKRRPSSRDRNKRRKARTFSSSSSSDDT